MKAFMCYVKDANEEAAVLVFAKDQYEARQLSYIHCLADYWKSCRIKDVVAHVLVDQWYFILKYGDLDKFEKGIGYVIERPRLCDSCQKWGSILYDYNKRRMCQDCIDLKVIKNEKI